MREVFRFIVLSSLLLCSSAFGQEYHPRLLFGAEDIPALREKLGESSISQGPIGSIGDAITAAIKGQRSESAIQFIRDTFSAEVVLGRDVYGSLLIYDVQHQFMTSSERSTFRSQILDFAENVYNDFVREAQWFHRPRHYNNWTTRHGGYPFQIVMYSGILFPDDSRAASFRERGLLVFNQLLTNGPNNGMYNKVSNSWDVEPSIIDGWDETFGSPNEYGNWAASDSNLFMHVLDRNIPSIDYETLYGRMWERESRYWTYILDHDEELDFRNEGPNGPRSYAGFGGAYGTTSTKSLKFSSTSYMLYRAYRYNNPVFAWLHLANPSWVKRTTDVEFLNSWNQPRSSYSGFLHFLSWGEVEPKSPHEMNWPLTEFWENAGIAVMRKSWTKNARVIADQGMPDEPRGMVWLHAGPQGSKYRASVGGVYYQADDTDILTSGPYICTCAAPGSEFLNSSALTQNVIIVDGHTKPRSGLLEFDRRNFGITTRLGTDTFLMDMSPNGRTDYQKYFSTYNTDGPFNGDLNWTRKVHYDRERDILWVKDNASVTDGQSHEFLFNWVADNPSLGNRVVNLPAGYKMVYDSNLPIVERIATHTEAFDETGDPEHRFQSAQIGGNGTSITMLWAVSKNEAQAREYIQKNKGVFISNVSFERRDNNIHIFWNTDEESRGRVEYGTTTALGQVFNEPSALSGRHEAVLPAGASDTIYYFRIVSADSHGDETIQDNGGDLFVTEGDGNNVQAPFNLRVNS